MTALVDPIEMQRLPHAFKVIADTYSFHRASPRQTASSTLSQLVGMAQHVLADGIQGRELVRSLSAAELFLLALWCLLGLVFKVVNAGFELVDIVLGKRLGQEGPRRSAEVLLEGSGSKSNSAAREGEISASAAPRKKWRQVASYIPEAPCEVNGSSTDFQRIGSPKKTEPCILCPGACVCREYLTEEMWRARMSGISSKSRTSARR